MPSRSIELDYRLLRVWWLVPAATACVLAGYYALGFSFRPEAFETADLGWAEWLRLIVLDQFLIECVTTFILFRLLLLWSHLVNLRRVYLTPVAVGRYLLAFLPVVLLAFFVFNPVTQTLRFALRGEHDAATYWDVYFYSLPLYLQYLALTGPLAYFVLLANVLTEYMQRLVPAVPSTAPPARHVIGKKDGMEHPLPLEAILWFTVEDRQYFAVTATDRYRVSHTIGELEARLDPARFVRLNRQVIVNLAAVDAFTPWFDGKYVVRLRHPSRPEFVLSRARARAFRDRFQPRTPSASDPTPAGT